MGTIPRFALDDKRRVIDVLDLNGRKGYCHEGNPETQINLRECVLKVRLEDLVDSLFPLRLEITAGTGDDDRPVRHAIWLALYSLVQATSLAALDPAVAIEKRFTGTLKPTKIGLRDFTSLSLFGDDVERLLRDLYGEVEDIDRVARTALVLIEQLAQFARRDLWQEHNDAEDWDYSRGIGLPEGCGISGSDWSRGMSAADNLRLRAREVSDAPGKFGKYTSQFATWHIGEFIRLNVVRDDPDDLPF